MGFFLEHMPYSAREGDPAAGIFSLFLAPAGGLYSLAMKARRAAYETGVLKSSKPPCRVVSIGSLSAGGSGKTQVASWLAMESSRIGIKTAVVSGGYRSSARSSGNTVRIDKEAGPSIGGDEAIQMASEIDPVPVYVSKDRYSGCLKAVSESGVSLCILDDAGQHLAIRRDVDVFVSDPSSPFGNGRCLPAGPLRESPSAMKSADIVWLAGGPGHEPEAESTTAVLEVNPDARVIESITRSGRLFRFVEGGKEAVPEIEGLRVMALSGIARPWRFDDALRMAGATVVGKMAFRDHHRFSLKDLECVVEKARECAADMVVTTAKDNSRSSGLFKSVLGKYGVLEISLEVVSGRDHVDWLLRG